MVGTHISKGVRTMRVLSGSKWTQRFAILVLGLGAHASALDYCIGADLSFLKQQEDGGTRFKDGGVQGPGLRIFRSHGYGWIRLRIFHTPSNNPEGLNRPLPNDLPYTIALAKQAKAAGFKILLDFHYSDTWADPGKQYIPKNWAGRTHAQLQDSVFAYTRSTMLAFKQAGVYPEMVQIGNEITHGMLWPDGKAPNWGNLADLLKAGIRGVDSATVDATTGGAMAGPSNRPLIMLHLDRGGDKAGTKTWFDNILAQGVVFDIIGQSYYPQWHGTLADLKGNLAFTADAYGKDIIVVELAYTALANGSSPFPLTDAGQAAFLDSVDRIVQATPNNHGKGIMWWEPTASSGTRNLFDAGGNAKPAMKVFDKYLTSVIPFPPAKRFSHRQPALGGAGLENGGAGFGPDGRQVARPFFFRWFTR